MDEITPDMKALLEEMNEFKNPVSLEVTDQKLKQFKGFYSGGPNYKTRVH